MALFKAVVWALIFLTKLRFPPGVSIAIVLKRHCKCHVQVNCVQVFNTRSKSGIFKHHMYILFIILSCIDNSGSNPFHNIHEVFFE